VTLRAEELAALIKQQKRDLNAIILAHFYQPPEIQDIADFVGDSLQLAIQAAETDADVIVFCGVHFMAESAKILNPGKTVLLPVLQAGCPMADMVTAEKLREWKKEHPGYAVVTYVNSSAEVKAESDICCTSSNALNVVRSLPPDQPILFVPDRNLGSWIKNETGRDMEMWPGYCPIHDQLTAQEVKEQMQRYPEAVVVVHPEVPPEVAELADAIRSTAGILKYVQESPAREFIIGTEEGFFHTLQKHCPDKVFHLARTEFLCEDMKKINLEILAQALKNREHQIEVPEDIRKRAVQSLQRMLAIAP
jgi:quinolinate synthase